MIRRALFTSAIALSFALVAPLTAQAQSIFVSAGAVIPTGDDSDDISTGYMLAGGLIFDVGTSGVWAGVDGVYGRSSADDIISGASFKPFSIMGVLGYSIATEGTLDPYIFGGAGLMGVKFSLDDFSESASGFGWQAGAGFSFGNADAKMRPYIEGRYQSASVEFEDDTSNETVSFFGALVGMTINVGN